MTKIKVPARLYRAGAVERAAPAAEAGDDDRRVALSFSSEEAVERGFGWEVLGHGPGEMDLARLAAGAMPLLLDHRANLDSQVGIVESADIVGTRGVAVVRFGKSARASEILSRVRDGEITAVSVGYRINRIERAGERDGDPVFRATNWSPLEISLVSIPADPSVGVGRSAVETLEFNLTERDDPMTDKTPAPAPAEAPAAAPEARAAEPARPAADPVGPERTRIREITANGRKFNVPDAQIDKAIESGMTVAAFQRQILENMAAPDANAARIRASHVGLTEREVGDYSIVKALRFLSEPNDRKAREAAGFEIEVSEAAAEKHRSAPKGLLIPTDILSRATAAPGRRAADLTAGTATEGKELVATDLLAGSFIDLLRKRSAIMRAGPRMLTGLVGNIAIPKQTGGATAYWVGEDTAPTQSGAAFGQVPLTPHTVGAFTEISRRLLIQSSLDVESLVRADLATVLALAIDGCGLNGNADADAPDGLNDNGSINVVDFGVAASPTFAEVVGMETAIAADDADVDSMSYIFNATMRGYLKTTPRVSGYPSFIMEGGQVNGYPTIVSNQAAAGEMWLGNWADFVVGMWSGLDLTVDPYSASTTGAIRVIAFQDVDFAVRNAVSFCKGVLVP